MNYGVITVLLLPVICFSVRYGCPSIEDIENFNNAYKKQLDEIGESGEIPDDLGVQASTTTQFLLFPQHNPKLLILSSYKLIHLATNDLHFLSQVSSPGAERLLRIPDDLDRFKDMPMWVSYLEDNPDSKQHQLSEKVLLLDSVDIETQQCVWKLANVTENRDIQGKGRPLSRKQKDWILALSFESTKRVTLYLDSK